MGKKSGLVPRSVLFGNPDKASPGLSPDGKQLAFLAPVDGVRRLRAQRREETCFGKVLDLRVHSRGRSSLRVACPSS